MYKVFYEANCVSIDGYQQSVNAKRDVNVHVINDIRYFRSFMWNWLRQKDRADISICLSVAEVNLERILAETFKTVLASGGLVVADAGILAISRHGHGDLPKGHVEPGEDIKVAALREVEEETGAKSLRITEDLPITYHCYQLNGTWLLKKTHWYAMLSDDLTELKPQQNEGISDLFFVNQAGLNDFLIDTFRSIREVLGHEMKRLLIK